MKKECVLVTSPATGSDAGHSQLKEEKIFWLMISEGSVQGGPAPWSWSMVGYCSMVERHDGRRWQPGSIKKERNTVRGFLSKDKVLVANTVPWRIT